MAEGWDSDFLQLGFSLIRFNVLHQDFRHGFFPLSFFFRSERWISLISNRDLSDPGWVIQSLKSCQCDMRYCSRLGHLFSRWQIWLFVPSGCSRTESSCLAYLDCLMKHKEEKMGGEKEKKRKKQTNNTLHLRTRKTRKENIKEYIKENIREVAFINDVSRMSDPWCTVTSAWV